MSRLLSGNLYRTVVLTILTGLAVLLIALSNRNVYAKAEVDQRMQAIENQVNIRNESILRELEDIKVDVRWLIQHAQSSKDSDTPQSD